MNVDRFTDWLALVYELTPEQRRQAFLMLALAEADDEPTGLATEACAAADEPAAFAARSSVEPDKRAAVSVSLAACEATSGALRIRARVIAQYAGPHSPGGGC
jgi:hypothetical protein